MDTVSTGDAEEWRNIPGFPRYQASSLGRVRSLTSGAWHVLRTTPNRANGYLYISAYVGGRFITRSVHRLVAGAFLGNGDGHDVNHKNGDKHDNRLVNLEYLSHSDNLRHAYSIGLKVPVGMKINPEQRRIALEMKGTATQVALARRFGVSPSAIYKMFKRHAHVSSSTPTAAIGV
jgi:hypothetical protein